MTHSADLGDSVQLPGRAKLARWLEALQVSWWLVPLLCLFAGLGLSADSYVRLAADELRQYGGSSIQVMRRLRYLLEDLLHTAPEFRHDGIRRQLALLDGSVGRQFADRADREFAVLASAQGHGPR